ncbi:glycosyltransferase family 2 protein, partial [Caulobacter sp. 17J65-9]|uniref:glycosyltransferase family 2 protein n=1 Tax=Caulobacter sp. 17J65-9 TaxID=2709382 RepID=UPI0013C56879
SVARVRRMAERDPRVRVLTAETAGGPAAARNRALRAARGRWVAVVDSDDLVHPDRFRQLIEAAERDGAEMVADDLLLFSDTDSETTRLFFTGALAQAPQWIDPVAYVRSNRFFGRGPALGYLKPVIRMDALRRSGVTYDERLFLTEDFDLVARLMFAGLRLRTYPQPTYFYRRRPGSLSHRLTPAQLRASLAADFELREVAPTPEVLREVERRRRSVKDALVFGEIVEALKKGRWGEALRWGAGRPRAAALLRLPVAARLNALFARRPDP